MEKPLTNPLQALILTAAKAPKQTGTVAHFQQRMDTASDAIVILADVSSSMGQPAGAQRKIDLLQEALAHVIPTLPTALLIAFSSFPQKSHFSSLPAPSGGTDLTAALHYVLQYAPQKTVVIPDGQPDNQMTALEAAQALTGIIDVIYCGPDTDSDAIAFMQRLAAVGGGSVTVTDIVRPGVNLALSLRRTLALPNLREGQ